MSSINRRRWKKLFSGTVDSTLFQSNPRTQNFSSNTVFKESRRDHLRNSSSSPISQENNLEKIQDTILKSFTDFIIKPDDPLKYKYNEYKNGMKAFLASSTEELAKDESKVCRCKEVEVFNMDVYGKRVIEGCDCRILEYEPKVLAPEDVIDVNQKVYVTICFEVGSFDDPCEFPGMAHFAEHMVFHPHSKRDFDIYLKKHNSEVSNGLTIGSQTLLDYSIGSELLEDSLQIFTKLFKAPSFSISSVEKELKVLNHEFHLKSKHDGVRLNDFLRVLGISNHKCTRFSWGNFESLTKRCMKCLRRELTNFIKRHYTLKNMTIIIAGPITFAVIERCLLSISEQNGDPESAVNDENFDSECNMYPFDTHEFTKLCKIVPMNEGSTLNITWELQPENSDDFYSKPLDCINSNLTVHEVDLHICIHLLDLASYLNSTLTGSLGHYLTQRFYIFSMEAQEGSAIFGSTDYGQLFTITFELTIKGARNYETILEKTFSYLKYLQSIEPDRKFFNALFHYNIAKVHLDKPKGIVKIGRLISENLAKKVPLKYILIGKYFLSEFHPKRIKTSLNELTPDSANIAVISKLFYKECNYTVTPFRVKYKMEDVPNHLMRRLKRVRVLDNFRRIKISYNLTKLYHCKSLEGNIKYASLDKSDKLIIESSCSSTLTYKIYIFSVFSPLSSETSSAFTAIWKSIFKFRLLELNEIASYVMITFQILWTPHLSIKIRGPSQHFLTICSKFIKILGTMQSDIVDVEEFNFAKEQIWGIYEGMLYDSTARTKLLYSTTSTQTHCSISEFYQSVKQFSYKTFCKLNRYFLSELRIDTKLKGSNTNMNDLNFLRNLIDNKLKYLPLLTKSFELEPLPQRLYPEGESILRVLNSNYINDSTILNTTIYQVLSCEFQDKIIVMFLSEILGDSMYEYFRIKKQVTYEAGSNSALLMSPDGFPLISLHVTSCWNYKVTEIQNHTDNYIQMFFKERIMKMNLSEFTKLWSGLNFETLLGPGAEFLGDQIMHPSLADIQTFYKNYLLPGRSSNMRKFCIQVCGGKDIDYSQAFCDGQNISKREYGHKAYFDLLDPQKYDTLLKQNFGLPTIILAPTNYYKRKHKKKIQQQSFVEDLLEFTLQLETFSLEEKLAELNGSSSLSKENS